MNFIDFPSFAHRNKKYNLKIHKKLKLVFSPKSTGPTSYIPVIKYQKKLAENFSHNGSYQKNIYKEKNTKKYIPGNLGEYERILYSNILYENGNTFVISGAMGSGKSTTLNYIFDTIEKDSQCPNSLFLKFNFNRGYKKKNNPDLVEDKFNNDLYEQLKAQLTIFVAKYSIADEFVKSIERYINQFADFFDLSMEAIHNSGWKNLDQRQKVHRIFQYIEKKTTHLDIRVEMATKFLFFTSKELLKKNVITIVFFDNLDRLPPISQENIIDSILNFNETANVRVVMTVRRSTKIKIDQQLKDNFDFRDESPLLSVNRGEYIYHHIYHHGPLPRKLIITRLYHLRDNLKSIFDTYSNREKKAILSRTSQLINILEDKNSYLSQALYCIGGESNRLLLTITPRLFCSAIIPFNEDAENTQSLRRSLYAGNFMNPLMDLKDKYVANIFSDGKYQFSLSNYLILRFLSQSKTTRIEKDDSIKEIFKVLKNYLGYSNKEILETINYLMSDRRALIGSSYKPGFKNIDELNRVKKDPLRLTELGHRYLNGLFQNAEIYLQQCILSLKWSFIATQKREDTIMSRFIILRQALLEMKDDENNRIINYGFKSSKPNNYYEFTIGSPVSEVAYQIVKNFVPLLKRNNYSNSKNQIDAWKDMIIFWQYNDSIYRSGNQYLVSDEVNLLQEKILVELEKFDP